MILEKCACCGEEADMLYPSITLGPGKGICIECSDEEQEEAERKESDKDEPWDLNGEYSELEFSHRYSFC